MRSTASAVLAETGWTSLYVGLVLAGASTTFATGVPTQGCYPDCVGRLEPTLAIAGLATLLLGVLFASVARRLGDRS